jgi:hypothetical protein
MVNFFPFAGLVLWCVLGTSFSAQQSGTSAAIYSCIDSTGRRHTSDRPVPDCRDREQRLLNSNGSVHSVLPPAMTPTEVADQEARHQQAAKARSIELDMARRERNLLMRYPTQVAHDAARSNALNNVQVYIAISQKRLASLAQERQALDKEMADLEGKRVPLRLRQQLNANEAGAQAQKDLVQTQMQELTRINALFDTELTVLQRLWRGG